MKLFISWSKEPSHQIALALYEWLPHVVPSVKPWISSEHIAKGARGRDAITEALAGTGEGVICLTGHNVREPWLNFEAGALSNHPSNPHVRTVLFDLKHSDVVGPLADFQHTILNDQNDVLKLVRDIAVVPNLRTYNRWYQRFSKSSGLSWMTSWRVLGKKARTCRLMKIARCRAVPKN